MNSGYQNNNRNNSDHNSNSNGNASLLGLYTVAEVSERAGMTPGRAYQQIKEGNLKTADPDYLRSLGWNESIKKPKHYITEEDMNEFLSRPRPQRPRRRNN